jgi:acyl-CoA synthetase (AMP-forming)/AMP-acid ligase II
MNAAITSHHVSDAPTPSVYLDLAALRDDRIVVVEKGSPEAVVIPSLGHLSPGSKVAIVDPDTCQPCSALRLGEIWVSSPGNRARYVGSDALVCEQLSKDFFGCRLGSDPLAYARTGLMGFLHNSSLFVTGSLDDVLIIRGFHYHPLDIENTLERCHEDIRCSIALEIEGTVVVGVETFEAGDHLASVPVITDHVLNEHHVIVQVILFLDPGEISMDIRGEKTRNRFKQSFLVSDIVPRHIVVNRVV